MIEAIHKRKHQVRWDTLRAVAGTPQAPKQVSEISEPTDLLLLMVPSGGETAPALRIFRCRTFRESGPGN